MEKLKVLVMEREADTLPATSELITQAENQLKVIFRPEYRAYLEQFGVISFGANETYGLGVKDTSHLNLLNVINDFNSVCAFPNTLLPLAEIGDAHYYAFDNHNGHVVVVTLPEIGLKTVAEDLEGFLISLIFA